MLPDDSSGAEDGNENAINNERRLHELLSVIESSGKFHETIKSKSPANEQMMIVRSGERVSDSDIESGRIIDNAEVISSVNSGTQIPSSCRDYKIVCVNVK